MMSTPALPSVVSSPAPPVMVSMPAPPVKVSLPEPPLIMVLPSAVVALIAPRKLEPSMVTLVPLTVPRSMLLCTAPFTPSSSEVRVMVALVQQQRFGLQNRLCPQSAPEQLLHQQHP